jgi:Uma2 family endonuclease
VTPAPRFDHQEAVAHLWRLLADHLQVVRVGHATLSPADVELDPHTLVQPDVFVVKLIEGRRPKNWGDLQGLLLAVEILSPSSARADRTVKRRRYQREGIPEYWVVDIDARLVERWRPGDERPEIVTDELSWRPDPGREPLKLDLPAYFSRVVSL